MNAPNPAAGPPEPVVVFHQFSAWFGENPALRQVDLAVYPRERLSLIGPAGSGKTTLLRSLTRLHDLTPRFTHQGIIRLHGQDIFAAAMDVTWLRRQVGYVSSPSTPLPGSVFDNLAIPLRLAGEHEATVLHEKVVQGLQSAFLWEDLKDRLREPALGLNSGAQRRLALARALVFDPAVLLLDDPCAGLDNVTASIFEDVLQEISARRAVVFATHDSKEAARASERTAFLSQGQLIECGATRQVFLQPAQRLTLDFITERF